MGRAMSVAARLIRLAGQAPQQFFIYGLLVEWSIQPCLRPVARGTRQATHRLFCLPVLMLQDEGVRFSRRTSFEFGLRLIGGVGSLHLDLLVQALRENPTPFPDIAHRVPPLNDLLDRFFFELICKSTLGHDVSFHPFTKHVSVY